MLVIGLDTTTWLKTCVGYEQEQINVEGGDEGDDTKVDVSRSLMLYLLPEFPFAKRPRYPT
jgi:hypothetical protein